MAEDVVAELDAELALIEGLPYRVPLHVLALRARDEIVALRDQRSYRQSWDRHTAGMIRVDALEEAAQRCDRLATDYTIPMSANNWSAGCRGCAGRIRALKEKEPGG